MYLSEIGLILPIEWAHEPLMVKNNKALKYNMSKNDR